MHKIEFYKIEREIIPTGLRLLVDNEIQISYEKLSTKFGYNFSINKPMSYEFAKEIIDDVVRIMESQSYDHGYEWECIDIVHYEDNKLQLDNPFHSFEVYFRHKDIY